MFLKFVKLFLDTFSHFLLKKLSENFLEVLRASRITELLFQKENVDVKSFLELRV